jgi:hypothetical protein
MRRFRTVVLALLAAGALAGCGSMHQVQVNPSHFDAFEAERTAVVMEFEARSEEGRQKTSGVAWGLVQVPDAGQAFAALAAHEMNGWMNVKTLSRPRTEELTREAEVDEQVLVRGREFERIAEVYGADTLVLGRIDAWNTSYWVVFPRGRVEFAMQCIDLKSGEKLWDVKSFCTVPGTDDRTAAIKALRQALRNVGTAIKDKRKEAKF